MCSRCTVLLMFLQINQSNNMGSTKTKTRGFKNKSKNYILCECGGKKTQLKRHIKTKKHQMWINKNQGCTNIEPTIINENHNHDDHEQLKQQLREEAERQISHIRQEAERQIEEVQRKLKKQLTELEKNTSEPKNFVDLIDDDNCTHCLHHINGLCHCDKITSTQQLLCDFMNFKCDTNTKTKKGTQAKSNDHEKCSKGVLKDNGFIEVYLQKKKKQDQETIERIRNGCIVLSHTHSNRLMNIVRKIDKDDNGKLYPDIGINKPGLYFIHQSLGSQSPPDLLLLNVFPDGNTKILPLECKSGLNIMWNDSLPKRNYLYLATDIKKQTTSMFTGDIECMICLVGKDILYDLNEIDNHTFMLREKNKYLLKDPYNLMGMGSFPRSNFSSKHVRIDLREQVFRYVYKRFSTFINV